MINKTIITFIIFCFFSSCDSTRNIVIQEKNYNNDIVIQISEFHSSVLVKVIKTESKENIIINLGLLEENFIHNKIEFKNIYFINENGHKLNDKIIILNDINQKCVFWITFDIGKSIIHCNEPFTLPLQFIDNETENSNIIGILKCEK